MNKLASAIGIVVLYLLVISITSCKQDRSAVKQSVDKVVIDDIYHNTIGQGDPILIIHGGPGLGAAYMEGHLTPLALSHQLIFYDQRNSGRSPLSTDSTKIRLAKFLDDIEDLRKHYQHDKISVLAHSWGGLLGMQYAIHHPDHLSHLILVNSNAPSSELNNQANTRLANRMSADDIEARSQIMRTEAFANQNPKAYEELMSIGFGYQFSDRNKLKKLQLHLPEDFGLKSQQLGYLFKDVGSYDFTKDIKNISCPTLLLYGIDDPLTPFALNSLSAAIPDAQVVGIDDAGHFPFIEQPTETFTKIRDFIK